MTDTTLLPGSDLTDIRALVDAATAAQDDPAALLDLHTDDAVIVNIAGRRVLGKDAFAAAMSAALASPLRDVCTSVDVTDVRAVTDDVAVVSCRKTVHDGRATPGSLPAWGELTYTVVRHGGRWRIALAQTTPRAGG